MAIARKAACRNTAEAQADKEAVAALAALGKTTARAAKSRERENGGSTGRRGSGGTNYERESRERESGGIERKSNSGSWRGATRRIRYRKLDFNTHSTERSKSRAEATKLREHSSQTVEICCKRMWHR